MSDPDRPLPEIPTFGMAQAGWKELDDILNEMGVPRQEGDLAIGVNIFPALNGGVSRGDFDEGDWALW